MGFYLILLGLLLLSLLATHFFLLLRKPILGFALGVLPIVLLWLAITLRAEWSLYQCRRIDNPLACEWTGLAIFYPTLGAVALLALSAFLSLGIDVARRLWKREGLLDEHGQSKLHWPLWVSMLIIIAAGGVGVAIGWQLANTLSTFTAFWLAPLLAFAGAVGFMICQERTTERTTNQ